MARAITSPSTITDIIKAAAKVRFTGSTRFARLPIEKVMESFLAAAELIPTDVTDARLSSVQDELYAISRGSIDPHGGTFKEQAIAASAKLHTLLANLAVEASK